MASYLTSKEQMTVPRYRSIADLAGAAGKLQHPLTEQELKKIVAEERAEAYLKKTPSRLFPV